MKSRLFCPVNVISGITSAAAFFDQAALSKKVSQFTAGSCFTDFGQCRIFSSIHPAFKSLSASIQKTVEYFALSRIQFGFGMVQKRATTV